MLEIIYEDENYIAINKPSSLMVHKSRLGRDVKEFALQMLRDQIGKRVYPCHRLDRPTSGVLIFALSSQAASKLGVLLEKREVEKSYLAVARGWPKSDEGLISKPLENEKGKEKKEAITEFKLISKAKIDVSLDGRFPEFRYSLFSLKPKTGRTHQLRRHLKSISHPILGDSKYGKSIYNKFIENEFAVSRLLLHCESMSFVHPYLSKVITITAPLGFQMEDLLQKMQLKSK